MDLHFMRLWDLYHPFLTQNQREITDLYFNCDLSLAEIAEQRGISRQSVSDCLQKCRKTLEGYEDKLHFVEFLAKGDLEMSCRLTRLTRWAEKNLSPEQAGAIKEIVEADYSDEASSLLEEHRDELI